MGNALLLAAVPVENYEPHELHTLSLPEVEAKYSAKRGCLNRLFVNRRHPRARKEASRRRIAPLPTRLTSSWAEAAGQEDPQADVTATSTDAADPAAAGVSVAADAAKAARAAGGDPVLRETLYRMAMMRRDADTQEFGCDDLMFMAEDPVLCAEMGAAGAVAVVIGLLQEKAWQADELLLKAAVRCLRVMAKNVDNALEMRRLALPRLLERSLLPRFMLDIVFCRDAGALLEQIRYSAIARGQAQIAYGFRCNDRGQVQPLPTKKLRWWPFGRTASKHVEVEVEVEPTGPGVPKLRAPLPPLAPPPVIPGLVGDPLHLLRALHECMSYQPVVLSACEALIGMSRRAVAAGPVAVRKLVERLCEGAGDGHADHAKDGATPVEQKVIMDSHTLVAEARSAAEAETARQDALRNARPLPSMINWAVKEASTKDNVSSAIRRASGSGAANVEDHADTSEAAVLNMRQLPCSSMIRGLTAVTVRYRFNAQLLRAACEALAELAKLDPLCSRVIGSRMYGDAVRTLTSGAAQLRPLADPNALVLVLGTLQVLLEEPENAFLFITAPEGGANVVNQIEALVRDEFYTRPVHMPHRLAHMRTVKDSWLPQYLVDRERAERARARARKFAELDSNWQAVTIPTASLPAPDAAVAPAAPILPPSSPSSTIQSKTAPAPAPAPTPTTATAASAAAAVTETSEEGAPAPALPAAPPPEALAIPVAPQVVDTPLQTVALSPAHAAVVTLALSPTAGASSGGADTAPAQPPAPSISAAPATELIMVPRIKAADLCEDVKVVPTGPLDAQELRKLLQLAPKAS